MCLGLVKSHHAWVSFPTLQKLQFPLFPGLEEMSVVELDEEIERCYRAESEHVPVEVRLLSQQNFTNRQLAQKKRRFCVLL